MGHLSRPLGICVARLLSPPLFLLCLGFSLASFPLLLLHPHWHVPMLVWTALLSLRISIHSNSFSWFSTTHYVFFLVSVGMLAQLLALKHLSLSPSPTLLYTEWVELLSVFLWPLHFPCIL